MWSSLPIIDIQEDYDGKKYTVRQNIKFTNFLRKYLKLRDKDSPLEKFRVRVRYIGDIDLLHRLVSFGATKCVKELDISFTPIVAWPEISYYFPHNLLRAKSITALNLECVTITDIDISFPSLKTIFLKNVLFKAYGNCTFLSLISRCPSIEYISVISCYGLTVLPDKVLNFTSSSLKSLKVRRSDYSVKVRAVNLESFTLVSKCNIEGITLDRCSNLKYIKIHAQGLDSLDLLGCHDSMKATINAPNLKFLSFNGYMKHNIFVETLNLEEGIIAVRDRKPTFVDESWKHVSSLRDFLSKGYGSCSTSIRLFVFDPEAFTFPKDFRKTCSPPLPRLKELEVDIVNYPSEKIDSEFWDSLQWMAPYAALS